MHEDVATALSELAGFLADSRQDARLLSAAGLDLEPAFLPLLVRLGRTGSEGVVDLAAALGRDHSTMSRQLARLQTLGLIERQVVEGDRRSRRTRLTSRGEEALAGLAHARRILLDRALEEWSDADRRDLDRLTARLAAALKAAASA